jgi:endonuclease I
MHPLYFFLFANFKHFYCPQKVASYSANKKWLYQFDKNDLLYGDSTPSVNCEHIVPQSLVKKNKIDRKSCSDLHLLSLCNSKLNSHRQNYKFAELLEPTKEESRKFKPNPLFQSSSVVYLNVSGSVCGKNDAICVKDTKRKKFEPPNAAKGKIARAVGYFYWNYNASHLSNELLHLSLMAKWNREYPASVAEKTRNEKIMQRQGNANIFISKPIIFQIYLFPPVFYIKQKMDTIYKKGNN